MITVIKKGSVITAFAIMGFLPVQAFATTLKEALIMAYQTNPSLEVNRANLRSQDESVAQATARLRPTITGTGAVIASHNLNDPDLLVYETYRAALDASLVLFDGGQTRDAINAAENLVFASRESLKSTDQAILLQAATAFLDVRRDQKFFALSISNVQLIEQQVQAMEDRFAVGAVTRTDVSLAKAQLAAAKTSLAASSGALALSKEVYRVVIGAEPTNLQSAPSLPRLPVTLSEAESIAMREHPAIKASRFSERAAEYDLARARAARAPVISLSGKVEYSANSSFADEFDIDTLSFNKVYNGQIERADTSISLVGQIPIYSGGALSSSMRSAAQILESRKFATQDTMRLVRQATASSWANIRVATASIAAARLQIEATQIAFDGIEEEVRLGARTTLDLLDAEQNLLSAKSSLASAQRDEYVAGLNLLSSMGLLTVGNLALGIPAYDPTINFDRVTRSPLSSFSGSSILNNISDRWK